MLKNVGGLSNINVQVCDMVSSDMWKYFPWRVSVTNIPTGTIPLVDGTQDYNAPTNIYRLTMAGIRRLDVTPNEYWEMNVTREISEDLAPRSYRSIRSACLQPALGKLRLESAVSVPSGMSLELGGEYQMNPPKITALTDDLWFDDQHLNVFIEGLLYWAYRYADDSRAGGLAKVRGSVVKVGQFGAFWDAVENMAASEDYGTIESLYPEQSIGVGRDLMWGPNIFGS